MSTQTQQDTIIYEPCPRCWASGSIYLPINIEALKDWFYEDNTPDVPMPDVKGKMLRTICKMCLGTRQVPEERIRALLNET